MAKTLYSFRGGIRMEQMEDAITVPSRPLPVPASVVLPLTLADGTVLYPLCQVGDSVAVGQPVARAEDGFSCPASVSGTVTEFLPENGGIRIASDGQQTPFAGCVPHSKKLSETPSEEIIDIIRSAGIVMPDGSGKPLYRVLGEMPGTVSRIFLNATECEPGLSACDTLLCERPNAVVGGLKILMKALGVSRADILLEDRREKAVNAVMKCVGNSDYLTLRIMEAKYPLSLPRVLFKALTGNDISREDCPENYGFCILTPEICAQVYDCFVTGESAVNRMVSVAGDGLAAPGVYTVPYGTSYGDLLAACGKAEEGIVIAGGFLSGIQTDGTGTVGPSDSALLCVTPGAIPKKIVGPCIHCGRCYDVCPAKIYPGDFIEGGKKIFRSPRVREALDACLYCGACTYVCPSKIPVAARMAANSGNQGQKKGEESEK